MRLKCLAGAYVGQVRDYSVPVGLAALRAGTAARLDASVQPVPVPTLRMDVDASPIRRDPQKHAARRRERGQ